MELRCPAKAEVTGSNPVGCANAVPDQPERMPLSCRRECTSSLVAREVHGYRLESSGRPVDSFQRQQLLGLVVELAPLRVPRSFPAPAGSGHRFEPCRVCRGCAGSARQCECRYCAEGNAHPAAPRKKPAAIALEFFGFFSAAVIADLVIELVVMLDQCSNKVVERVARPSLPLRRRSRSAACARYLPNRS